MAESQPSNEGSVNDEIIRLLEIKFGEVPIHLITSKVLTAV